MRPKLVPGALLIAAALLAGCSSADPVGPLGDGGSPGQQCAPARQGQTIAIGIYPLENHGRSPATIRGVTLPGTRGLKMTRAWVTPIYRNLMIGTAVWPPSGPAWAHRIPADGAVVKPGQALNLVFGLTHTTKHAGRSPGPQVTYTAGGSSYVIHEAVSLKLAATCF
jgi:hypothetical protein